MQQYSFLEKLTVIICVTTCIFGLLGQPSLPKSIIVAASLLSLAIVAAGNNRKG